MCVNAMKIVPADATIIDLKKKTAEYEEQAKKKCVPQSGRGGRLRAPAEDWRGWRTR